jgi:hypothetical protein
MSGAPLQRGIESIVAEVVRVHLLENVLGRPEVRRGLSPEAIERIRRDVLDRLKASEEEGRANRGEVEEVLDAALGAAGPAGAMIKSLLKAGWERLAPQNREER